MSEGKKAWEETREPIHDIADGMEWTERPCITIQRVTPTSAGWLMTTAPEFESHAKLAAAAPELYRALDAAQKCIEHMREWCLRDNRAKHATEYSHDVRWEALNALRKARGET